MAPPAGNGLLVIERILRDREGVWQQIIDERDLRGLTGQMLASSAVSLACYGAVLGASNGWAQALSSAAKLPLLFLATLTICLPTLYLFNLVFGARLSMMQALTVILVSITVISVLTLADPAPNGGGSVPAGALAPAGGGLAVAVRAAPPVPAPARPVPVQRSNSMSLLYIWILLFGFVGTQLGWTLGTFYADIVTTIARFITGG